MLKWLGAMLIVAGCGSFGYSMASAHRREEAALQQLIGALDFMQCELQYRLTALPDLCRQAGQPCRGAVGQVLTALALELEGQLSPDVEAAMAKALNTSTALPARAGQALETLGQSLGRFDVDGQVRGLEYVRGLCRRELEELSFNRDTRLRSYQTLGLCAGAALAILFV